MAQDDRRLRYREAVAAVSAARVRYAEAFLRFKIGHATDGQAHQQAILATNDELTVLEAEADIASVDAGVRRCR